MTIMYKRRVFGYNMRFIFEGECVNFRGHTILLLQFYNIPLNRNWYDMFDIQPEVLLMRKKVEIDLTSPKVDFVFRPHDLPTLFNIWIFILQNFQFFACFFFNSSIFLVFDLRFFPSLRFFRSFRFFRLFDFSFYSTLHFFTSKFFREMSTKNRFQKSKEQKIEKSLYGSSHIYEPTYLMF